MDFSALLKLQALRTLYLAYSSYKTPNFRPTHRPTDFGRKEPCDSSSQCVPSRHALILDITKSVAHSFRVRVTSFDRHELTLDPVHISEQPGRSLSSAHSRLARGAKILGLTGREVEPISLSLQA